MLMLVIFDGVAYEPNVYFFSNCLSRLLATSVPTNFSHKSWIWYWISSTVSCMLSSMCKGDTILLNSFVKLLCALQICFLAFGGMPTTTSASSTMSVSVGASSVSVQLAIGRLNCIGLFSKMTTAMCLQHS